jgi:two-component system, OmpR family, phosphate regulon sensor histidine kinase PhoR
MNVKVSTNVLFVPQILVVDDEARIREGCQMVLSELGFEVAIASDGEEGLRMIEERYFDIILLDLMMPTISGFDVLSRVRDLHPDTVVIVITGYATIEHSIEAMKKGAFDFIPKPFNPEQLRAVVAKAIKYYRALQDIADSRSRLRMVVNRLTDGVMTTDDCKRIVLANPAFRHVIGCHGDDIIGHQVSEHITDETLTEMIDQALAMPLDTSSEITRELVTSQGADERILSARCAPFRGRAGRNLGTITVLHDITALKKIDQMKSDFVSMVSHEIRSPMNSLLMQLKIILDGLAGTVTDKQRVILERASGKILNLTDLVTELLDLARIEAGLITHDKETIEIQDLLAEQVKFHEGSAREKNIGIRLEVAHHLPVILANRQGMDEVFTNLITNAIKYSPANTEITIAAGVENRYLTVAVGDSGFGIPGDDLDKIFTRFYRVKNADTREIHGTGLGLAIVKSIVEAHHGSIRVESEIGQGTVFTVLLPLPESSAGDAPD